MKKIIIQAGHSGRTSGQIGAPNEQSFNVDISNKVRDELVKRGFEVKRVNADPTSAEIAGDWDLFLAIHYDADIYGSGGGFVDYPEPSTDGATKESQRIAYLIRQEYFGTTLIVNKPERSNKNTRYYYMWKSLSSKTPCVIIECGVGMHVPDDHSVLHFNRPKVVEGLVKGICLAFNVPYEMPVIPQPEPETPQNPPSEPTDPIPPVIPTDEDKILIQKIRDIVYDKWTWIGKTNNWKLRLSQLKELLP